MARTNSSTVGKIRHKDDTRMAGPDTARAIAAFLPRPLPVAVRVSERARRVSLRFVLERGLEVVTPAGVPADSLIEAVGQRRDWLARVCERLTAEGALPTDTPPPRPDRLVLTAFARQWRVEYVARKQRACTVRVRGPKTVLVSGPIKDSDTVRKALLAFCRDRAGELLRQAVATISREADLPYDGVTIRAQRTRWGSCTAKGHLNLNFTLAFLPWELCRLVLFHELCHTRELNHSSRFWDLLERHIPHCREVDAQLGAARYYLPLWVRREVTAAPR